MQQQVDSLYKKMSQAERVAQLYGIRSSEWWRMENCLYRNVEKKIPNGIGHVCQYACALDLGP